MTPPRIAPPTGSCAAASCTGAAMAMDSKATAPNARYIRFPQIMWNAILQSGCGGTEAYDPSTSASPYWLFFLVLADCSTGLVFCPATFSNPNKGGSRGERRLLQEPLKEPFA